jgi:hypothetical protein
LNDYILVEPSRARCAEGIATLIALLAELGLPVQQEKFPLEGTPTQEIVFLGVVVDAVRMELRLPLAAARSLGGGLLARKSTSVVVPASRVTAAAVSTGALPVARPVGGGTARAWPPGGP